MNNDLSIKEDIYSPSRSDDGTYVDKLPPNQKAFAGKYPGGVMCPCKGYHTTSRSKFKAHTRCNTHKVWLEDCAIEYKEPIKKIKDLEEIAKQQQKIIADYSNKIENLKVENAGVKYLEKKIKKLEKEIRKVKRKKKSKKYETIISV